MGRIAFYDIINGKIISFIYFYKDRDIVISDTQPELVRGVSLQSKFPYFFIRYLTQQMEIQFLFQLVT